MFRSNMLVLLLISAITTFAQDTTVPKTQKPFAFDDIRFYGNAVLNFATMKGSIGDHSFNTTTGYAVGAYGELMRSKKFGYIAGIQYNSRGAGIKSNNTSSSTVSYRITYIDIPLGISFYPVKSIKLLGAVVPAFKINESVDLSYLGINVISGTSSSAKGFEMGVNVGVQYVPSFTRSDRYVLTAGYTYGLTEIAKRGAGFSGKNRNLFIGLAYEIN